MEPTNRETATVMNIVPARYSPTPEKFTRPVSQDLRNIQSRLAQGFTLKTISHLENELHKADYKREPAWQGKGDNALKDAIRVAKTTRTVMMNNISEWAGALDEAEFEAALPTVWGEYAQEVSASMGIEEKVTEEVKPIQVITRPEVPEDAPRSVVEPPHQPTLAEVLGSIEQDNKEEAPVKRTRKKKSA